MRVSVLVPVYGVEKYIERCAVSLFGQTYEDIEFIFVDDCTPDKSIEILRSVASRYPAREHQMRIIRNETNRGVGETRAIALAAATADFVMFVDSDDYLPPCAVESLCAGIARSGADIVDGGWCRVTSGGESGCILPCLERNDRKYLCTVLCQNLVSNRLWGRIFRRSLYVKHGITFASGIDYCEDFSVMTRLMFYARRTFIRDMVYCYCDDNAASYTHTVSERHVRSFLKSNSLVLGFFTSKDVYGLYKTPLQIGMINVLRSLRRNGSSFDEADKLFNYKPEGMVFRVLAAMFRGRCPYRLAEMAYLAVRNTWLKLHGLDFRE